MTDFEFGGHRVTAGAYVVFSQYVTHSDPTLWPDPLRFSPERWDRSRVGYRSPSPYEYLPFGTGFRRCIGASLATAELAATLALLVQRCDLSLAVAEVRPTGLTATYPDVGVPVRVSQVRNKGGEELVMMKPESAGKVFGISKLGVWEASKKGSSKSAGLGSSPGCSDACAVWS